MADWEERLRRNDPSLTELQYVSIHNTHQKNIQHITLSNFVADISPGAEVRNCFQDKTAVTNHSTPKFTPIQTVNVPSRQPLASFK